MRRLLVLNKSVTGGGDASCDVEAAMTQALNDRRTMTDAMEEMPEVELVEELEEARRPSAKQR